MLTRFKCHTGKTLFLILCLLCGYKQALGGETARPCITLADNEGEAIVQKLVDGYRESLPKINAVRGDTDQIAKEVVDFLKKLTPATEVAGAESLVSKIKQIIEAEKTIQFVLPGFPFKSLNRKKVLNPGEPDLAEVLGLATLDHLCTQIKTVCGKGAQVVIVPDAIRIADHLGVMDQREAYIEKIRKLIQGMCPQTVVIQELNEFKSSLTQNKAPAELSKQLAAISVETVKNSHLPFVQKELDCDFYTDKIQQHSKEARANLTQDPESYQEKTAQIAAEEAKQFAQLLKDRFPNYKGCLRLSVNHHDVDLSQKVPVCLVRGFTVTPWHCAPFVSKKHRISLDRADAFKGTKAAQYAALYKGVLITWLQGGTVVK